MNIDIVRQGMLKEAGWQRYFPRLATRVALNQRWGNSLVKALPWFLGAAVKDLPGAAVKGGVSLGKGGAKTIKWLAQHDPGFLMKMNRMGKMTVSVPKLLGWLAGGYSYFNPDQALDFLDRVRGKTVSAAGNIVKDTADYINDTKNGVGTRVIAGPQGSVASLFNPVSGLTGGVDYVPKSYIDFVQKYIPGDAGKTTAHLTMKGGAMALLAAGLVGSYRAARHLNDLRSIDKADRPSKDLASQLSTTFEGDLSGEPEEKQKKAAAEESSAYDIVSPGNFSAQNLTATAIPVGSLLLAAGLAYKGVDSVFDKVRNKRLDSAIAEKEQAVKKLITARAQIAKGGQAMESATAATAPLADSSVYTKAASQEKIAVIPETVQLFGTLSAAVILASALGSYAYTSASDEDNIKYKAYKKALKEYAKAKSGMTPITMAPSGASDYFAKIDAAKQGQPTTARQLPSYDSDSLNKPISVSF